VRLKGGSKRRDLSSRNLTLLNRQITLVLKQNILRDVQALQLARLCRFACVCVYLRCGNGRLLINFCLLFGGLSHFLLL
jgi:hypothetical protein